MENKIHKRYLVDSIQLARNLDRLGYSVIERLQVPGLITIYKNGNCLVKNHRDKYIELFIILGNKEKIEYRGKTISEHLLKSFTTKNK